MYLGATELTQILPPGVSIGTNTYPLTIGEVGTIIAEISAELDSYVFGAGYAAPVPTTATSAYMTMQLNAKRGAGWRVLGILFPGMGGPGDTSSLAADYRDAYLAFLKDLKGGDVTLIDAGSSQQGVQLPRSFSTSHQGAPDAGASALVPFDWAP